MGMYFRIPTWTGSVLKPKYMGQDVEMGSNRYLLAHGI